MPSVLFEQELGELFTDLHHSGLFADGKAISDAIFHQSPSDILASYRQAKEEEGFDLKTFYEAHFAVAPEQASTYQADTTQPVGVHIERLWDVLKREPDQDSYFSSKIPLPEPYIVPGGRFNEIYYWDSYFTMLGLQVSGRLDMVEHMINNFTYLIDTYGFIPNGNRTYFLGRSQPPFFSLMVQLLAEERGDAVLMRYQNALEQEHQFWMDGSAEAEQTGASKRVVSLGTKALLNRYFDNQVLPRTEMYLDDVELLEKKGAEGEKLLLDIRAACESGWDFSARWCEDPMRLETIATTDLCPVDLNCLLYHLEQTLARSFAISGNGPKAGHFATLAEMRVTQIMNTCWDPAAGYFFDYNHIKGQHSDRITAAGLFPLYFGLASQAQAESCAQVAEQHLLQAGGLLTTAITSGQQWDAPNGWAPLQWIAIQGLLRYGLDDLANEIKTRWINLNRSVYKRTGKLMEKYNVVDINLESGGGEYPVQDGFGWTNGVLLKLLKA